MIDTCKYKKLAKNRSPNFQHKMEKWHQQIHLPKTSRNPVPVSSSTRKFCGVNPSYNSWQRDFRLRHPNLALSDNSAKKEKEAFHPLVRNSIFSSSKLAIKNWEKLYVCIYIYIHKVSICSICQYVHVYTLIGIMNYLDIITFPHCADPQVGAAGEGCRCCRCRRSIRPTWSWWGPAFRQ